MNKYTGNWKGKIVITGAAGLVGQNLVILLRELGCGEIVAIDKHRDNLALLQSLHPQVHTIVADLATPGAWQDAFAQADAAVLLHAQIGGKEPLAFERNNVGATGLALDAIQRHKVGFTVHVSSSVVNSAADDDYTRTKKRQEALFRERGVEGCVLRPTLMYGWFDPKHFGWLSRFMEKSPVFPIPGHGRYMRQPLYNRDFCRAILWCLQHRPTGMTYDLVGQDRIDYIDIIRAIKAVRQLNTVILPIPYGLFYLLLKVYALFSAEPPFTASQLKALTAGDDFTGVDIEATFGFAPTPFAAGVRETFCDPVYSRHVVARN